MSPVEQTSTKPPTLDVSAVTYNSSKWIARFFESLVQQNFPPSRINLLIRDNGSTDDTVAQCRAAAERYAGRFGGIHISEGENLGFGYGHNRNLGRGEAPFFLVTNVDLEFEPDSVRQAIETALGDDDDVASWEFRQKPYEHPKYYDPVTLETNWSSSACVLFRREALAAVGGYEERIFLYGEDVELSYRLRDQSYRLRYCPKAVCRHYSYEHAGQLKPQQFFGSTLANFYIRLRYGSAGDILVGVLLYLSLWFVHPEVPGLWRGLLSNGARMLRNAPYFLLTRKRSREPFPLRRWDYELAREGAFHVHPPLPDNPPLASVVMRTYAGRLSWLQEAVASVRNQTYPNVELIVVEDGSDLARGFMDEVGRDSGLASVAYRSLPKQGRCRAGNEGLRAARGEFVVFLDDDDLFFADHLEALVAELLARPDAAAAYGLAYQVPTRVLSTKPLRYRELARDVIHRQPFSRVILWHHNYLPIQAVVFRRALYEEHGGFDESLENLEDWNLWTRYSLQRDFLLVEKVTSLYRVPAESGEIGKRQRSLDDYYAKAVEKQREMRLSLSPAEVIAYSEELSRNINAVVIPFLRIRNILVRNRLLNLFYYVAIRLVGEIRAQRRRRVR